VCVCHGWSYHLCEIFTAGRAPYILAQSPMPTQIPYSLRDNPIWWWQNRQGHEKYLIRAYPKTIHFKTTSLIIPDIIMVTAKRQIPISRHPPIATPKYIDNPKALKLQNNPQHPGTTFLSFLGTPIWPRVKTLVPNNMYRKIQMKKHVLQCKTHPHMGVSEGHEMIFRKIRN
jgi:hypothetical protein